MSGIEIAGLAVPLLLASAASFRGLCREMKRYRRFNEEFKLFQVKASVQRLLFQEACRTFLAAVIGHDEATALLRTPTLSREELEHKLSQSKATTDLDKDITGAILDVLQLIETKLQGIEANARRITDLLNIEATTQSALSQEQRRLRAKAKFAVSSPGLTASLGELQRLIQDLKSLTSILSSKKSSLICPSSVISPNDSQAFKDVQLARNASMQLYEAFSTACSKHSEHQARFPLHIDTVDSAIGVRFILGFKHETMSEQDTIKRPTWMVVESILSDSDNTTNISTKLPIPSVGAEKIEDTSEAPESSKQAQDRKRRKVSRVQFVIPERFLASSLLRVPSHRELIDLSKHQNFCSQLFNCYNQPRPNAKGCVGYLKATSTCQHLVYLTNPSIEYQRDQSISLASIFSLISKRARTGGLIAYERLRLATLIAKAVLQFSHTPWLGRALRSYQILFYGVELPRDPLLEMPTLKTPYINASVKADLAKPVRPSEPSELSSPSLSLGVLLLELAFQNRLESLRKPCDMEGSYTLMNTAHRLASSVGRELGGRYGEVVQRCLRGPSSSAYDLEDAATQREFYRDVVGELERLEEGMEKLQLAD